MADQPAPLGRLTSRLLYFSAGAKCYEGKTWSLQLSDNVQPVKTHVFSSLFSYVLFVREIFKIFLTFFFAFLKFHKRKYSKDSFYLYFSRITVFMFFVVVVFYLFIYFIFPKYPISLKTSPVWLSKINHFIISFSEII